MCRDRLSARVCECVQRVSGVAERPVFLGGLMHSGVGRCVCGGGGSEWSCVCSKSAGSGLTFPEHQPLLCPSNSSCVSP